MQAKTAGNGKVLQASKIQPSGVENYLDTYGDGRLVNFELTALLIGSAIRYALIS